MSRRQFDIVVQSPEKEKKGWIGNYSPVGGTISRGGWIWSLRKKGRKKKRISREVGQNQESGTSWTQGKKMSHEGRSTLWT